MHLRSPNLTIARTAVLCALFSLMLFACSHTSNIHSVPSGAKVYINGKFVGQTPTHFKEETGRQVYSLRITKEGYETLDTSIRQTEYSGDVALAAGTLAGVGGCGGCFAGLFACWPIFWSASAASFIGAGYILYSEKQLDDEYTFHLDETATGNN